LYSLTYGASIFKDRVANIYPSYISSKSFYQNRFSYVSCINAFY
jgi:hypothetical protein